MITVLVRLSASYTGTTELMFLKFSVGDFYAMHEDVYVFLHTSPGYIGLPITSLQKQKKFLVIV
jgi:hypothetical protein